jgi:hypothetical protein
MDVSLLFSVASREVAGLLTVDCLPEVPARAFAAFAALRRALLDGFRFFEGLGLREWISGGEDGGSVPWIALDSWTAGTGASEFTAGVGSRVAGVGDDPMNPSSFSVGARVGVNGVSDADSDDCSRRK